MDVGLRSRLITTINPPRVILGLDPGIRRASASAAEVVILGASSVPNPFTGCLDAADPRVKPEDDAGEGGSARKILSPPPSSSSGPPPGGSITTTHPTPVVILGLDPGIRRASASAAEVVILGASSVPNPFTGCPDAADPRVKPEDDAGEGGSAAKNLIPAPVVILGPAPRSSITTTHPTPVVILGLDPGIRRASARAVEVVLLGASSVPNPFTGCLDAADPRVKPEDDAGEGGSAAKKLIPAPSPSCDCCRTVSPGTRMHTSFRRDRSGFLAGRRREGPKRTDGRARNQAFHVVLPKGRGAPTGGWQGKWAPVSRFANRPTKNANIPDDKPQPETPP